MLSGFVCLLFFPSVYTLQVAINHPRPQASNCLNNNILQGSRVGASSSLYASFRLQASSTEFDFISTVRLDLGKQFKVSDFIAEFGQQSLYGVFIISDSKGEVQYVSSSTLPVVDELMICLNNQGGDKVHSIRAQTFSVANQLAMNSYRGELLRQLGECPPGNIAGASCWYNIGQSDSTQTETAIQTQSMSSDNVKSFSFEFTLLTWPSAHDEMKL